MSVLITGIGTVGAVVVEKFTKEGFNVIVYDLNPAPPRVQPILSEAEGKVKLIQGDVTDLSRLINVAKANDVEGIIHTVGITHRAATDRPYLLYPTVQINVNAGGTQNVLEVARILDLERVIYTSSGAVLGRVGPEVTNPIKETHPVMMTFTSSFYDISKYMSELLTEAYHRVYGLDTVTCRLSWVRGIAGVDPGGIGYYLQEVLNGKRIVEPSGAGLTADFSYNRDVAQGIYLLYTSKNIDTPPPNRLYNLSAGRTTKLSELVEYMNQIGPGEVKLGPGMTGKWEKFRSSIRPVPFDIERMRKIGYTPRTWKQAIQDWAEWLKGTKQYPR